MAQFTERAIMDAFVRLLDWLRRGRKGEPVDFLERAQRLLLGNTRRMLEANAGKPAAGGSEN